MNAKNFKHDRPTIGILAGWSILDGSTPDHYRLSIVQGIQSAARSRGCYTLLSWGIRRINDIHKIFPAWPLVSPKTDFVPVGPWNTDGLIVFTPLADENRSAYLRGLQAQGFPILFIGTGEAGPQISANHRVGIHQAIAHLVEHGHRSVAFIGGLPTENGDSEIRMNAYHAAVARYQLETDERLVSWGWHNYQEGYSAMQKLLTSGVKFTAVLASNDKSAVGAMRAIHDANLRIPEDIAVIGFDDQPDALAHVPPLSSVHVPLNLMGEQALMMMADHLLEGTPLETLQISTRIVRRQSCGCIPAIISSALNGVAQSQFHNHKQASEQEKQQQLVSEMLSVLPVRFSDADQIHGVCTALVDAFCKSLNELTPSYFQTAFINCITDLEKTDNDLTPWQEMISALRREMNILPMPWDDNKTRSLAEDLLHQARTVIGESSQRQSQRHKYWRVMNALALNTLMAHLSAALSENQVAEVLNTHLASVGILHIKVIFFEADGDDPVARSVVLGLDSDLPPLSFPTQQFPPPQLYTPDQVLNVILLPLVFQHESLGYVAFDATNDLGTCAMIAMQLATTIQIARLYAQVVELSLTDALTGIYNRRYFEIFLRNEINRSKRFSRGLGIILVDCDNFKEYNDTYGHPAGDEALQQIAKCLLLGRQNAETVARLGGDEFVVVLPETGLGAALEVGRRIQEAVAQLSHLKCRISVSIGLVAMQNNEADAQSLIHKADLALYESKRKGRNRISFFRNEQTFDEKEFSFME